MKKIALFSLIFLFIFSACRKDVNNVNTTTTTPDPKIIENWEPDVSNITGSVIGFVVNVNNEPESEVAIKLGNLTVMTDAFGHFFMDDITMNEKGTFLTADKEGFFKGSRRFFPKEGATSRVKIQLIDKVFTQSFDAQAGGTVTANANGAAQVLFSPNSIRTESGDAYTGTVHVATRWLDPTLPSTFEEMPGNLQGVNNSNVEVVLSTYGMIAVELEGDAGEALNIAENNTAELRMPVPNELLANAPTEIPLWSFHEGAGMWSQEGTATLQEGIYVGNVTHFSFWNCDYPYPLAEATIHLEDDNGNPLVNIKVQLEVNNVIGWGSTGCGYTDSNGDASGKFPAGEELFMTVYDQCGGVLLTATVGPFDDNTTEYTVVLPNSTLDVTTLNGTLVDCNNNPITNGAVIVKQSGYSNYHYLDNADFNISQVSCNTGEPITVQGVNLDDLLQSDGAAATSGIENNLGNIAVCDQQLENFISVTIDGVTAIYLDAQYQSNQGFTNIYSQDSLETDFIYFGFDGQSTGDYSSTNYLEGIFKASNGWNYGSNNPNGQGFSSFEVTEYGPNIIGTFSGEVMDIQTGNIFTATGSFNLIQ